MDIIIDYREKDLIKDMNNTNTNDKLTISHENLELGDIQFHVNGTCILIFERKTVSDLAASISDGRYKEQSHRLTNASLSNHQSCSSMVRKNRGGAIDINTWAYTHSTMSANFQAGPVRSAAV